MKKYNVVICGAGNMAAGYDEPKSGAILTHAHAISCDARFNLIGFYDINQKKAEDAAKKWGGKPIGSFDEIFKFAPIVCCTTPDEFHYETLISLLNPSVKAVICEKPITTIYEHAKQLVGLYKQYNIPIFVNYTRRYLNEFIQMKHWVKEAGELIVGRCLYGKGVVHNCSHMINVLQYLLGTLQLETIGRIKKDYFDDDPSVDFSLKFGDALIQFNYVPCDISTVFELDLCFSKGRIIYDDAAGSIKYFKILESDTYTGYFNYKLTNKVMINRSNALVNLYDNVFEVLENHEAIISSGEDAMDTLKICEIIKNDIK